MENKKCYIILHDWANGDFGENDSDISGIFTDYNKALDCFNALVKEERAIAEENGWTIYEDTNTCFDAGEEGYYISNHSTVRFVIKYFDD